MEIICPICNKTFIYKEGKAHFNRAKNHYCSLECLIKANTIHGLAGKKINSGKQNERYQLWCQAKKRAKRKNLEFNLKPTDIPEIPKVCPILKIPIIIGNDKLTDNSPTLERIDNNKGYIKNNILIISYKANRIKNNATLKELKMVVKFYEKIQSKNK